MTEHRTVEAHTSLSFRDPLVALGLTKAIVRQSQTSSPPSAESLADGVTRITEGRGVDVVIESVGGALTGQALATLALHGVLTSLGYSAGRQTTLDVTDLIWKCACLSGFALAAQSHAVKVAAWATILPLLTSGTVKPIVESTYQLEDTAEALRHLIEDRPFGRVVLAGWSLSVDESSLPRMIVRY